MYRILIADDEAPIREGLKFLLDYDSLGFTICAEASDGLQACQAMVALAPDVVLLDIRMPGLTGLEAIHRAREQGFQGKVIIVSSYSDFSYAQQAMRYGVQHYLTKPIEEDALQEILITFRQELDQDAHSRSAADFYREKAQASVITDLLLGRHFPDAAQLEQLQLTADTYQAVIVQQTPPSWEQSLRTLSQSLYARLQLQGREVLLLKGSAAVLRFRELLAFCQRTAHVQPEEQPFFACGQAVSRFVEIPDSYTQALQLSERRFFCEQEQNVLTVEDLPDLSGRALLCEDLLQQYTSTLLDGIHTFSRRLIAQTLQQLQQQLRSAPDSIASIRLFLTDLYLRIKMQVSHLYPGSDIHYLSNAQIISTIEQARYLHEIILFFSQRFDHYIDATGASNRDSVLDDILHYIHHNYASNVTLESIAPLFGYNRSYLGKIFTKKVGQNFNSYVDQVRIDRAKELLLQDSAKVYNIAEQVGYKNVDYFHIKFRKYVGMSPSEYRKKFKDPSGSPDAENPGKGSLAR